jgi:tetratricopeptide (TPR) repeat protein
MAEARIATMRSSALRCLLLASFLPPFLSAHNAIGEQTWTEVRSPHFRVVTDGSGNDARKVANEFEQMRYVFSLRFKNPNIESGPPLTIVAARDEGTYRSLDPSLWKSQGDKIAGVFYRGWEKQFALIRLDTWGDANQVVVYHEYTHSILHANFHWLPIWLDEGFAEFYAYTRFQKDRIYVGAPSMRMRALHDQSLIPVSTMLDVNYRSPYFHDEVKEQLFYAEAWAMVHYMVFGTGMENGEKLNKFFNMLQDGTAQQKAFQDIFGDPHAFDSAFSQYVSRLTFVASILPPDHGSDPKSFSERKLAPAEADYELACFHIGAHDRANGRALIEKSLALDPTLAAAHEELGYLNFDQGKDDDAEKEWKQATTLDSSLPRSLFALTMSGPLSGTLAHQSPDQLRAAQLTLQQVTRLAPLFAPPYVELAIIEWQLGYLQQAYKDAHQAETLEPWRAGYHILTGHILLHGKQPAFAVTYSRYVATHWFGPDHDEAVDLWQAAPPTMQGVGTPLALDMPAGVVVARGRLLEVSCSGLPGASQMSITLMPDKPADAKPLTFTSYGRLTIGFSDTLWWGEDHFSSCHHLAGHPGVLGYKPQGPKGPELVDLEVRDDLPDNM